MFAATVTVPAAPPKTTVSPLSFAMFHACALPPLALVLHSAVVVFHVLVPPSPWEPLGSQ